MSKELSTSSYSCRKTPRHCSSSPTALTAAVQAMTAVTAGVIRRRFGNNAFATPPATGTSKSIQSPGLGRAPLRNTRHASCGPNTQMG
jgi:hypothetical protein